MYWASTNSSESNPNTNGKMSRRDFIKLVGATGAMFTLPTLLPKIYSAQIDTVQWLTYTDPEGRFSIQYPSFIKIVPKQNRFDTNDLSFSNENSSIIGYLVYELSSNDSNRLESKNKSGFQLL